MLGTLRGLFAVLLISLVGCAPGAATTTSGVQMRLNNLGYGCGPPSGAASYAYTLALQGFQKKQGLTNQKGTVDNETINALRSEYEQGIPS